MMRFLEKAISVTARAFSLVTALFVVLSGQLAFADNPDTKSDNFFKDRQLTQPFPSRVLSGKGATIEVFYDTCQVTGKVSFKEEERNSRIRSELLQLVKAVAGPQASSTDVCTTGMASYVTKYTRSTLTISAPVKDDKVETRTVLVGPIERLFLGVDLPVGDRKTLQYDEESKSLVPKDKAAQLYLSLNIASGDVLTATEDLKSLDRLSLKLMVKASSHPLDAYGIGVGYRLRGFDSLDLNGFSVFVAYLIDKQDGVAGGVPQFDQNKRKVWRAGISYDLGTALKWLKL